LNLKLFEFDYDLTFVVFFLSPEGQVYGRYGGRDARGPEERLSLDGLRYTMSSVLKMHLRKTKAFAPQERGAPRSIQQLARGMHVHCFHCHQVKEFLNARLQRTGKWRRELAWRYPLPENVGLVLELDRGNVVKQAVPHSPAARAGLQRGDTLRRLNGVPVHSQADVQFGLDQAPAKGLIAFTYERAGKRRTGTVRLPDGWRKSDISWRASMRDLAPYLPVSGIDLTPAEKKGLGLSREHLAFRPRYPLNSRARAAGLREGDIILGIDDKKVQWMDADDFLDFVHREYLAGDRIKLTVLRKGRRLQLAITLR
jgi:predicted metalloprotease with PDZ domain